MADYPAPFIWKDGEIVPWPDAKIHVSTDTVLRGSNVFEGIRGYSATDGEQVFVFRLEEHLNRLWNSMKVLRMTIPYSKSDLSTAVLEIVRRNQIRQDAHIRLTAYFGEGPLFGIPDEMKTGAFIMALARPSGLDSDKSIACCVSSWRRIGDNMLPPRVKAGANYHQSRMVAVQAQIDGYDSAIMLNDSDKVSEGPGACLVIVRDGTLITPSVTSGILESITRDTLMRLSEAELGKRVLERDVDRTELYMADEAFYCGSAAEVLPITSIDRYPVGSGVIGPITRAIQAAYRDVVRGKMGQYRQWLTPVYD